MPALQDGDSLPLSGIELLEKQTKPKPLHTESSLLSSMETAGKELENADLKASMKDTGIGTPATRAAIIETLFSRQYIVREKKNLVPTEKGLAVYNIIRDKKIADVEMTGMWENTLAKIESGEMNPDTFRKGIEVYARQSRLNFWMFNFLSFRAVVVSARNARPGASFSIRKSPNVPMWIVPLPSSATRATSS